VYIDHSVYLDLADPPDVLETMEERADYVHRICCAWDFHVHPEPETFELFSQWKEVFDRFPIPTSPAYHAFRAWFGWEPVNPVPGLPGPIPLYQHLDRLEDRPEDPCSTMI
jgi:hypothetical protein